MKKSDNFKIFQKFKKYLQNHQKKKNESHVRRPQVKVKLENRLYIKLENIKNDVFENNKNLNITLK